LSSFKLDNLVLHLMRDSNLDVIIVGWQAAMSIIESYVLLGRGDFLRLHAEGVVKVFDIVIGNVKERGMLCTLPVIDSLIQVQTICQMPVSIQNYINLCC
jgi:hypothetical protein